MDLMVEGEGDKSRQAEENKNMKAKPHVHFNAQTFSNNNPKGKLK